MPVHAPHAALRNDPLKPFFREHKSPHFAREMGRGIFLDILGMCPSVCVCVCVCVCVDLLKRSKTCTVFAAGGPGPLCQAWSNEARHNGGCNLGRRVVYLQLHGHDEGDVPTLVMRALP